jgi:hypothetical protein
VGASLGTVVAGLAFQSAPRHPAPASAFSRALAVNLALALTALLLMAFVLPSQDDKQDEPAAASAAHNYPGVRP